MKDEDAFYGHKSYKLLENFTTSSSSRFVWCQSTEKHRNGNRITDSKSVGLMSLFSELLGDGPDPPQTHKTYACMLAHPGTIRVKFKCPGHRFMAIGEKCS